MNKKQIGIWAFFQIFGMAVLALGVAGVIAAGIGAGAVDAVAFGFMKLTNGVLEVGTWTFLINVVLALLLLLVTRKPKVLLTLLSVLLMGMFINLWSKMFEGIFDYQLINSNIYAAGQTFHAIWIALVSVVLMAIGVALLINFKSILTPYDESAVYLEGVLGKYFLAKMVLDGGFMLVGLLLGFINGKPFEQVGPISLVIVFGLGPLINLFINLFKKGKVENETEQVY